MRNEKIPQPTARGLQKAVVEDLTALFRDDRYKAPDFLTDSEIERRKPEGDPEAWTEDQRKFWEAMQMDYNRHRMKAPEVFMQNLPIRETVSPEPPPHDHGHGHGHGRELPEPPPDEPELEPETDDPYPYILVRLDSGEIEEPTSPHRIALILLVGIYDDDPENNGHLAVMEIIERIQAHYRENPALEAFTFVEPFRWYLQDEMSYPYFIGAADLRFDAPAPQITQGEEYA